MGILYDFFSELPFWQMQPFSGVTGDAVALAEKGKVYVVYLPSGGDTTIDLNDASSLTGTWFNPVRKVR